MPIINAFLLVCKRLALTASVEGEPPFRLTIGNATGVELRYQGEDVNLVPPKPVPIMLPDLPWESDPSYARPFSD